MVYDGSTGDRRESNDHPEDRLVKQAFGAVFGRGHDQFVQELLDKGRRQQEAQSQKSTATDRGKNDSQQISTDDDAVKRQLTATGRASKDSQPLAPIMPSIQEGGREFRKLAEETKPAQSQEAGRATAQIREPRQVSDAKSSVPVPERGSSPEATPAKRSETSAGGIDVANKEIGGFALGANEALRLPVDRDASKTPGKTAESYLPTLHLSEQPFQTIGNSIKQPEGKSNLDSEKAGGSTSDKTTRQGEISDTAKHSTGPALPEISSSLPHNPRLSDRSLTGAGSSSASATGTRSGPESEHSTGDKPQQQPRFPWGAVASSPGDAQSRQSAAGPSQVPNINSSKVDLPLPRTASEKQAGAGTAPTSAERRIAGSDWHDIGPPHNPPIGNSSTGHHAIGCSDTERQGLAHSESDTTKSSVHRAENKFGSREEPGISRAGRLDSIEKLGSAAAGSRTDLPADKVGHASGASLRPDVHTGKSPSVPIDQTKVPAATGRVGPDVPIIFPPRFTPWIIATASDAGKSGSSRGLTGGKGTVESGIDRKEPEFGLADRAAAKIKSTNDATEPGIRPTDRQGATSRSANDAKEPGIRVTDRKTTGNAGKPEKGAPAVKLIADLQGLVSAFVRSMRDAVHDQPNRSLQREIADVSDRTAGPPTGTIPPERKAEEAIASGESAPHTGSTDRAAACALLEFIKMNRKQLESALKSEPGSNALLDEFAKLVDEIDRADDDMIMPEPIQSHEPGGPHAQWGRDYYVVQENDTLDSIAFELFNDARISYVIYEINKEDLPATLTDGAVYRQLNQGTILYLPTASEVSRFLAYFD